MKAISTMTEIEAQHLGEYEELYAELAKSSGKEVGLIVDRISQHSRDFAKQLIALGYPQLVDRRTTALDFKNEYTRAFYPVDGVPSKRGKAIAEDWMQSRGVKWNGDIRSLRIEMEDALIRGETVPHVGFNISLRAISRPSIINQPSMLELTEDTDPK